MVQFSKLRLAGFKSFVDPTELLIEPGMTGVVGPNGCGKSNLVEALRWVMGETSARRMRGGEMDDVIFGGTSDRPARNIAEVTVVLDNSTRTAPAAFNAYDEIEVTRRIERSSGSAYKVNGKETRARDVQLLFADAGTGAQSTGIVSQGQVAALINARPSERRHLLEEAAGIAGLHARRNEAEQKLKAAESNLERLDDILVTLNDQLEALRKQARHAARYRRLSEQIRYTEAMLLYLRWQHAIAEGEAAHKGLTICEAAVGELAARVAAANTASLQAEEALPDLRQRESAAGAELQRMRLGLEQLDQEEGRLASRRQEAERHIEQIQRDLEREQSLGEDAQAAFTRLQEEHQQLLDSAGDDRAAEEEAAEQVERLEEGIAEQEQALTALTESMATHEAQQRQIDAALADLQARRGRLEGRAQDLAEQREILVAQIEETEAAVEAEETVLLAEERLEQAQAAIETAEQARQEAEDQANRHSDSVRHARSTRDRLAAEAEGLAALLETRPAGQAAPILDQIQAEPGVEAALGAAFGDELDLPDAALDPTAPARWEALSDSNTAPMVQQDPDPLPQGATPLANQVAGPAVLSRGLQATGLVASRDQALALRTALKPGQRLVTLEGAMMRWDGLVVEAGSPSAAARRLEQRNRLAELEAQLAQAEQVLAEAEAASAAAQQTLAEAQRQEQTARERARDAETALRDAREAARRLAEQRSSLESRLATLEASAADVARDLEELENQAEAQAEAQAALPDLAAERLRASEAREALATARTRLFEARAALDRLRQGSEARNRRLQAIEEEQASWRRRLEASSAQIDELKRRRDDAAHELEQLAARPMEIEEQREKLRDLLAAAEDKRRIAADDLAAAESHAHDAARALKEAETAMSEAREARARAEGSLSQARDRVQAVAERIKERLRCPPDEILLHAGLTEADITEDPEVLEERLAKHSRDRENMGPVNLCAETELEEMEARVTSMETEREDLIAAIARLRQGINTLNREARERLMTAFQEVNSNFERLFARLFGGGRAYLQLTDPDEPLTTGLEIMASPPGKRLQILSLLSGGEQALTATALLFSVFLSKPAPICVLDEVDAPLDDANVDRFCALVEEIGQTTGTRFLVITHHRLTMARVDRLFGVTMAERGISQLVSVDLQMAEALRATA